ncbi:MAG: hypothetical protein K2M00_02100 [Muribaculaceae bacterium]|nr:hypothetical protein [Muribaculaceae bacterium]
MKFFRSILLFLSIITSIGNVYGEKNKFGDELLKKQIYACEIVNKPLFQYLETELLPILRINGFERGCPLIKIIWSNISDRRHKAVISCYPKATATEVPYLRGFTVSKYKYCYYYDLKGVNFEIYTDYPQNIVKPIDKMQTITYTSLLDALTLGTYDASYEIELIIDRNKITHCEVKNFVNWNTK